MASDRNGGARPQVREAGHTGPAQSPGPPVRKKVADACDDCAARTSFQAWHDVELEPSFNVEIDFGDWNLIPPGKRAVIELVTALIGVPDGEWARLRLFTSNGTAAGNFDLALVKQGVLGGQQQLVATHSVRVYSDGLIVFNVNRDNATTKGNALICVSGYVADA
jgi:hypothetical protein